MSQRENSPEVRNYIREKIRAGKFLIKSLHQRQQTILNIAKEIVDAEFSGGDRHIVEKICADLTAKGQSCTPTQVEFELKHLGETAKTQIMRE